MAADRALAEDHQRARHDVGAFHRDRDRRGLPAAAEVVLRAEDDALAAVDVHRVARDFARHLGAVVLGDRRRHGRFLAAIDRGGGRLRQRAGGVGIAGDARQRFLDAFETADGQAELLADARVRAGHDGREFRRAARGRGQGDGAADRQALDQHAPAVADVVFAADQLRQRQEDVLAVDRTVLEHAVQGEMAAADVHARRAARNERQRDAAVLLVAEQAFGIVETEREPDDRRHRRQRDVALLEVQAHAEHLRAVPFALADDAEIGNRGRIGTRGRAGQAEAGNLTAVGEARQVEILLLLRTVMQQQFAGAQRIRHADGRAQRRRHRGEFLDHAMVREGGKTQAAVLLRDDHAEELVALDVIPDLGREIGAHVRRLPVVGHAADFFHRAVEEGALFGGEFGLGLVEQGLPHRAAGEQLAFETDRTGFKRDFFRVGERRQDLRVETQRMTRDERLPDRRDQQRQNEQRQQRTRRHRRGEVGAGQPADHQHAGGDRGEHGQRPSVVGRDAGDDQQYEERNEDAHALAPETAAPSVPVLMSVGRGAARLSAVWG